MKPVNQETMPYYQSHKVVQALTIQSAMVVSGGVLLRWAEPGFEELRVSAEFILKHGPEGLTQDPETARINAIAGWVYVVYADGYASLSPAEAFLDGYSPLPVSVPQGLSTYVFERDGGYQETIQAESLARAKDIAGQRWAWRRCWLLVAEEPHRAGYH